MAEKISPDPLPPKEQSDESNQMASEYGLENMLAPDKEKLSELQEHSAYHYSQKELDHQRDYIDQSS